MRTIHTLIAVLLLSVLCSSNAYGWERRAAITDSLRQSLRSARTPGDSLATLLNIFDISTTKAERRDAAHAAFDAAVSSKDTLAQTDLILHLAYILQNDDAALRQLKEKIDTYGESPRTREIGLFIDLLKTENFIKTNPNDSLTSLQTLILRQSFDTPDNSYNEIKLLFALCSRVSESIKGELLPLYIGMLDNAVGKADLPIGAVRNLVYTRAANAFSNGDRPADAVRYDKKTLNILDSLAIVYASAGRRYRKLQSYRYDCYRRMLGNYPALNKAEVNQFHNAILELVRKNPAIAADYARNPRAHASYLMATGQYAEALPLLLEAVGMPANTALRYQLYKAIDSAAIATSDSHAHQVAVESLYALSQEKLRRTGNEREREMKLIAYVDKIKDRHSHELEEQYESSLRKQYILLGIAVCFLILLIIVVIILFRQSRHKNRLNIRLEKTVDKLKKESQHLRETQQELIEARDEAHRANILKTEFINNMSHEVLKPLEAINEYSKLIVDCIPADKRSYLDHFAEVIDFNTKLILSLVNDVLDMAAIDNGTMTVVKHTMSVTAICEQAINNVFTSTVKDNPDVKFVFNPAGTPDFPIYTDPGRLAQILINLLGNAVKFTAKGSITLAFSRSDDDTKAIFSITDTGIGIPEAQHEKIFEKYKKLDPTADGCGLGLYISRMIAHLLGGALFVDKKYRKGARFVLEIPI